MIYETPITLRLFQGAGYSGTIKLSILLFLKYVLTYAIYCRNNSFEPFNALWKSFSFRTWIITSNNDDTFIYTGTHRSITFDIHHFMQYFFERSTVPNALLTLLLPDWSSENRNDRFLRKTPYSSFIKTRTIKRTALLAKEQKRYVITNIKDM